MDFAEGKKAFCFEPDSTKARVLYEARILSCFNTGNTVKKKCYKVHFLGWNNSWDRIVPEKYLLPYTEDNKKLKQTLELTIRMKNNRKRKRKIDEILKTYFGKKLKLESDESTSESSEDEEKKETPEFDELYRSAVESKQNLFKQQENKFVEEAKREPIIQRISKIDIPQKLKMKLKEDRSNLRRKKKISIIPAKITVIHVLNDYVDSHSKNKLESIYLEALDSIRTLFDHCFAERLLYDVEKSYWEAFLKRNILVPSKNSDVRETRRSAKRRSNKSPIEEIANQSLVSKEDFEELRKKKTPSAVCGCCHFLRLFTDLPNLFMLMRMNEEKQKRAVEILSNLLSYIDKNSDRYLSAENFTDYDSITCLS